MRPNSLFFDREQQRGFTRVMSVFITIAFLVSIGYLLIRYKRFAYLLHGELFTTPMFGWLLLLYAALAFLFVFMIRWSNCRVKRLPALWAVAIFLVAVLPRVFVLLSLRAPNFDGVVLGRMNLSALLLKENTPALIACALSALCAAAVYFIARYFDEGSAPAAGLLLALYPANIVTCLEQPVLQAAMLLALLSVLFALAAFSATRRDRVLLYSALSGLLLSASGIVLASAWLFALAFGLLWVVLAFSSLRQKVELRRLLLLALAFCAVFFSLRAFVFTSSVGGTLDADLPRETAAGAAQQARENEALLDLMNWQTLQKGYNVQGSPVRLDEALPQLWLEKNAALSASTGSAAFTASALSPFSQGIRLLDFFYIAAVFLFAWIGGLLRRRGGAGDLLLWVFLVWATAHLFSDRQMIVRALGMPVLMIVSAYGVFAIVGSEPRPKEQSKYASCVNRGALNLGDIPPTDTEYEHPRAFHPATGGAARPAKSGGVYAAMEADIMQRKQQDQ
ncbi:MAG: hypothetical protein VB061_06740 [Christensenella sp.]|nr:hypothetical protein [Christensenella sp.]